MYLDTHRESGSFKHVGYQPQQDRDFGGPYCATSNSTSGEATPTSGGTGSGGSGGPTGRNIR